jgi:SAM-dependent methyltransferase
MKMSEEQDDHFYTHVQHALLYHKIMLRDEARNVLFYEALKRYVTSETRVLDIGSGSGVWAITAAKLGARKVTAIESDPVMIPIIQAHVRENGVADKVEIIHGNSYEINLRHKYELIISETIGNQAFDESIVVTMIDARKRFLARDGILIPQKLALVGAPGHFEQETGMPLGVPIKTEYLKNLAFNITSRVVDKNELRILADPVTLLEVDFREITEEPNFQGLIGRWNLEDVSKANVVALWARSELTDGITLDTWKTICWQAVVCPFKAYELKQGELEFHLNFDAKQYHWTARVTSAPEEKPQSYTPFFAYAKLKSASQFAPRRRKVRKKS